MPKEGTPPLPNCGEGRDPGDLSQGGIWGESEGGGSHTYSGDLGVPLCSGEPGGFSEAAGGWILRVLSLEAVLGESRFLTLEDKGQEGREAGPRQRLWGWDTGASGSRYSEWVVGVPETHPPPWSRQRSSKEAGVTLRVAMVAVERGWSLDG